MHAMGVNGIGVVLISFLFLLVLIDLGVIKYYIEGAPTQSLVAHLPGFNATFPSNHYSGYVSIDGKPAPKNLFYYFVESERKPSNDPLILWLNGGPGCSSLDGFVYEHGPFNFQAGKGHGDLPTLHLNPYSWSKVSSIIYLDSPAGVGFSYSENTTSYSSGDFQTAYDTHNFLLKWFTLFPEFVSNPFYIAGESYAGVYVPTLANEIVKGLKNGWKPLINFKGYMVGNGVTDNNFDGNALVPFVHGMGLISEDIFEETTKACRGNYMETTPECLEAKQHVNSVIGGLNIYDILEPCYHNPSKEDEDKSRLPLSFKQLGLTERPLAVRKRMFGRAWPLLAPLRDGLVPMWPHLIEEVVPCVNDAVAIIWLNNDDVKRAIHVNSKSRSWELCTDDSLSYTHDAGSMINYHKNLTLQGYRVLIYSGDHDMCVPFTGSEAWTKSLGYKIIDAWRPWQSDGNVAGFTQGYANNLTFLTIKGAGHTVPEYKPKESLDFYSRWLEGKPI